MEASSGVCVTGVRLRGKTFSRQAAILRRSKWIGAGGHSSGGVLRWGVGSREEIGKLIGDGRFI